MSDTGTVHQRIAITVRKFASPAHAERDDPEGIETVIAWQTADGAPVTDPAEIARLEALAQGEE